MEEEKGIWVVLVNGCWWVIPSARNREAGEIAMGTQGALPVINEAFGTSGQLTRREMVRRLVAGMGAGGAGPPGGGSHSSSELLRNYTGLNREGETGGW